MPLIEYVAKAFRVDALDVIERANGIIEEYEEQGFTLTLRQLYYQFVSRAIIPNTEQSYKRLGSIINDARLAGLIDWDSIEDRLRQPEIPSAWDDPRHALRSIADQYAVDTWEDQDERVECWIEKDALVGVIQETCERWGVPYLACRGYVSQSAAWQAHQRWVDRDVPVHVLYLGDHDPSGIDMSRDLQARFDLFSNVSPLEVQVDRLALNWDQVQQYKPPPNPTKLTDSRADGYITQFGKECWELDALEPAVIAQLVDDAIRNICNMPLYQRVKAREEEERGALKAVARRWSEVREFLRMKP